jgi:hypothetical protein
MNISAGAEFTAIVMVVALSVVGPLSASEEDSSDETSQEFFDWHLAADFGLG